MVVGRITSRIAKTVVSRYRSSLTLHGGPHNHLPVSIFRNKIHSLSDSQNKLLTGQISLLHNSALNSLAFQRFGISSSASPQSNENTASENGGAATENFNDAKENTESNDKAHGEEDLTMEDLIKLVTEKEELLKTKQEEIEKLKNKVLRTYADMENIMDRTKRETENSKKYAIQYFAKNLLQVADTLSLASTMVKKSFTEIETAEDPTEEAVSLLESLLEGVEMTEKQLAEIFKKYGVEKYNSINEAFDPGRHHAMFQVPDLTKAPNTVAEVVTEGYMFHDRVLRPAGVGVTIKVAPKDNN